MYTISVEIEGTKPILYNKFQMDELEGKTLRPKKNSEESDREEAYKTAHINSKKKLFLPFECLMACITEAGKFEKRGKSKVTTCKTSLVPAGIKINQSEILLLNKKGKELKDTDFVVDKRPVVIPSTGGAVPKCRAKVEEWKLNFDLECDETIFSSSDVRTLLEHAGTKIGLGSFRICCKGYYGSFKINKFKKK